MDYESHREDTLRNIMRNLHAALAGLAGGDLGTVVSNCRAAADRAEKLEAEYEARK